MPYAFNDDHSKYDLSNVIDKASSRKGDIVSTLARMRTQKLTAPKGNWFRIPYNGVSFSGGDVYSAPLFVSNANGSFSTSKPNVLLVHNASITVLSAKEQSITVRLGFRNNDTGKDYTYTHSSRYYHVPLGTTTIYYSYTVKEDDKVSFNLEIKPSSYDVTLVDNVRDEWVVTGYYNGTI